MSPGGVLFKTAEPALKKMSALQDKSFSRHLRPQCRSNGHTSLTNTSRVVADYTGPGQASGSQPLASQGIDQSQAAQQVVNPALSQHLQGQANVLGSGHIAVAGPLSAGSYPFHGQGAMLSLTSMFLPEKEVIHQQGGAQCFLCREHGHTLHHHSFSMKSSNGSCKDNQTQFLAIFLC